MWPGVCPGWVSKTWTQWAGPCRDPRASCSHSRAVSLWSLRLSASAGPGEASHQEPLAGPAPPAPAAVACHQPKRDPSLPPEAKSQRTLTGKGNQRKLPPANGLAINQTPDRTQGKDECPTSTLPVTCSLL